MTQKILTEKVQFAALLALGQLTPLPDLASHLRPYRTYTNYGFLYRMCVDGELPFCRCPRTGRIYAMGDAKEIARIVKARFHRKNGRWIPECTA